MKLLPKQITDAIGAAAPFQRKELAKSYIGQKVDWEIIFKNVYDYNGKHRLSARGSQGMFPWIYCDDIDLNINPEFKIMKDEEKFYVKGEILEVDSADIRLKNCEFYFTKSSVKDDSSDKNVVISDSIVHLGNGNISGNTLYGAKSKVTKNKNEIRNTPKGLFWHVFIPLIVAVLAGLILYYFFGIGKPSQTATNINSLAQSGNFISSQISSTTPLSNTVIRPLQALETGKSIGELPNDVYFFSDPSPISSEILNPTFDFISASNVREKNYSFEIQKIDNRYYLVGYISSEDYANIGTVGASKPMYTILFPNKWGIGVDVVAVPFDSIYTIKGRTINIDSSNNIYVLDLGFKSLRTDLMAH